jgi:hypothetical protein
MSQKPWKTPSRSSPQGGGTRACLCPDGTYSRKCCDGSLMAQGIGRIVALPEVTRTITTEAGLEIITQDNKQIITN